jgi:putative spermidine/putrescine transport system ATP-binding protein
MTGPCASVGTIAAQVYQGGHVDLYLESADSVSGRLLVRLPAHEAMMRWPIGARVNISVNSSSVVAFPTT